MASASASSPLAVRVGAWVPSYLRAMAWRGVLGLFMRFRRPSVVRGGFWGGIWQGTNRLGEAAIFMAIRKVKVMEIQIGYPSSDQDYTALVPCPQLCRIPPTCNSCPSSVT